MVGVQRGTGGNREEETPSQDLELPPVELAFEHSRHSGSKSADYGSLFHHCARSTSSVTGEDEAFFSMSSSMPASPFTTTTTLSYISNSNSSSTQPTVPSSSMPSTPTNPSFASPSLSSSSSQYHSHSHPQYSHAQAPPPVSTTSVKREAYGAGGGVSNAPSPGAISFSSMHITSRYNTPKLAPAGLSNEDDDTSNILDDKSGILGKRKSSLQMDVDSS